jgi:hypothetical protein
MHTTQSYKGLFYSILPTIILIMSVTYFSSVDHIYTILNNERYPANVNETCRQLMKGLIGTDSVPSKAWKKLNDIPSNYRFDFEKYKMLKQTYISKLNAVSIKDLEFQHSPEGILALAEAVNKDVGSEIKPALAKLSFLKRRKLDRLVSKFEKSKKVDMDSIEELVANIYSTILGPKFKLSHLMNSQVGKNKIMTRIVQEDLLKFGLMDILSKNSELRTTQSFFKKFISSYKGKYLATMLFNLPVLAGFPPLYLPGLKKLKIPPVLAREILEKGLTDEMMQKLNVEVLQELSIKLEYRNGYEVMRRYYMAGISIYLSYVILDEFYEGEKIREENLLLEEIAADMSDILDQAELLQSRGIDIFNDSVAEETIDSGERAEFEPMDNPFCRAMQDCLKMHKTDTGEEAIRGSRPYKECKTFMDPENKCKEF